MKYSNNPYICCCPKNRLRYPKPLLPGGTVGLVAPSSGTDPEQVIRCISLIHGMGFQVKAADNLTCNYGGYMAGGGRIRGEWLNRMFADPEVDAIFCIRGGNGANRAIGYLDLEMIKRHPKIFVGFSDITAFHLIFNQICGFVTFHGPMVASNMLGHFDVETRQSFFSILHTFSAANQPHCVRPYPFQNPVGFNPAVLKAGRGSGLLVGGNLSILCASLGTPYEVDTKEKILFIEEVDEEIRRIDRMVFQLHNAGKFKECAGIILGQFTNCVNENIPSFTELNVFWDALKGLSIPLIYNIQAGHGFPNMTLPLGAYCSINTATRTLFFY